MVRPKWKRFQLKNGVHLPFESPRSSPGSVDLTQCDVLYKDLSKGLESLMLNSHLHLLYLVTPYDMMAQCKPDWMAFYRQVALV